MGGMVKREGTYAHLWLIRAEVWQKTTEFCKAIILQLKKKKRILAWVATSSSRESESH